MLFFNHVELHMWEWLPGVWKKTIIKPQQLITAVLFLQKQTKILSGYFWRAVNWEMHEKQL